MQDSDAVVVEEVETEHNTTSTLPTPKKLSIMSSIAAALSAGSITQYQARSIRSSMGISQATFTRKQRSRAERKALRKMQADSRRANRGNGKGQKKSGRV